MNSCSLHGISDASKPAYAAALYAVSNNGQSTLLISKSKVAPVKSKSIPNSELCGALLLARLSSGFLDSLDSPPKSIHFWTDLQIVLCWLQSHPSKWEVYVANRVSNIISLFPAVKWNHVTSKNKPADLATRGSSPKDLAANQLWWCGLAWLINHEDLPPSAPSASSNDFIIPCVSKAFLSSKNSGVVAGATAATDIPSEPSFYEKLKNYSNFSLILMITAYLFRWKSNAKLSHGMRLSTAITATELKLARIAVFKAIQLQHFAPELKCILHDQPVPLRSTLSRLAPFIGDKGLLRVGSRLQNSLLDYFESHPILLPKSEILVRRLGEQDHRITLHRGPQFMLSHLHHFCWIIGGMRMAQGVYRRCARCTRYFRRRDPQLMAPLPSYRLNAQRPFANTGIDSAGPFPVRLSKGRGTKAIQGYIEIFVCMVTRAAHIEVVSDLTTEAFLAAYSRFTARRGVCCRIFSDNGTTFRGAAGETARRFQASSVELSEVVKNLATQGTSWEFIPPRAPHFRGLWEAAVSSFKAHFKRVIGDTTFTFEMSTLSSKIEACVNSRPLCALNLTGSDNLALTPAHFLIGESLLASPEPCEDTHLSSRLTARWQLITQMRNSFWLRWRKEVMHQLQIRNKWSRQQTNLDIDDVVLMTDKLTPPSRWPLGRIVAVHPGRNGLVRVVTFRTSSSRFVCPVVKLIKLQTEPVDDIPRTEQSA